MEMYFLATTVLVSKECVDYQASAITYQPEHKQLTLSVSSSPTQTTLHPKTKPHTAAQLGLLNSGKHCLSK